MKSATEALSGEMSKIGEAMTKAGQSPNSQSADGQEGKVRDAEVKEEKTDDKKEENK